MRHKLPVKRVLVRCRQEREERARDASGRDQHVTRDPGYAEWREGESSHYPEPDAKPMGMAELHVSVARARRKRVVGRLGRRYAYRTRG